MADAEGPQRVRRLVAQALDVGKREDPLVPLVVAPDERAFFGFDTRPFVHNVVGKVKALRHNDLKILLEILVGRELQPVTESFDQNWLPP